MKSSRDFHTLDRIQNHATFRNLIAFCQCPSLDSALQSLQLWERDRARFNVGQVALSYREGDWIVLVSKDLHDLALPF